MQFKLIKGDTICCVVAVAGKGWGQRRSSHRKVKNIFCVVYEMSIRVVHGSCILSCYYNGILMPHPDPFLWTVVPVTLASCKLVEHKLALPCHPLKCGCFEVEQIRMFPFFWSLLTYFPLGSFVITFKVVIKKRNSRLSHA